MGGLSIVLAVVATVLLYGAGYTILAIVATIAAVGDFWSWGVMHYHATERAKQRKDFSGGFYDFTKAEVKSVPDWITWFNMGFSLLSFAILIVAIVLRIK